MKLRNIYSGDCENCHHDALLYQLVITNADGVRRFIDVCYTCRRKIRERLTGNGEA